MLRGAEDKDRMDSKFVAALVVSTLAMAACSNEKTPGTSQEKPVLTAATLGEQTVRTAAEYLAQDRYASADLEQGKLQAQVCRACHTLEAEGVHMIGPRLYGVFGSKAGKSEGFPYSQVLADAEFTWTPRALDAWLTYPGRFLPGNLMSFPGVRDQAARDDLMAYLLTVTAAGQN